MIARIDALERTVRDILAYSRPIVPKPQHFDVHRLIDDAAAGARASAKAAEIVVEPGTAIV